MAKNTHTGEKWCPGHRDFIERTAFAPNAGRADGLQSHCRSCHRENQRSSYARNAPAERQRSRERKRTVIAENRQRVWEYLTGHPCVDCDERDPVVLEFDHRAPCDKEAPVARLVSDGYLWEVIAREIAKCDVRCANCHKRRHWRERLLLVSDNAVLAGPASALVTRACGLDRGTSFYPVVGPVGDADGDRRDDEPDGEDRAQRVLA